MTTTAERHTTLPTTPAVNNRPATPVLDRHRPVPPAGITRRQQVTGMDPVHPVDPPPVMEPAGTDRQQPAETTRAKATRYVWATIRLAIGWTFLWAFLDKTFGLGFATDPAKAWIDGGQPTLGFLAHGTEGPFAGFYQGIAGAAWADWLFMTGLLGIGLALMLGIGMRIAAATGALLLIMMWTAVLPPPNNPFMDDHLINAAVLIALALVGAGNTLGLGKIWARLPIVNRLPWLK